MNTPQSGYSSASWAGLDGIDSDALNTAVGVHELVVSLAECMGEHLRRHGLTPARFAVLHELDYSGQNELQARELAHRGALNPGSLGQCLSEFEELGFVRLIPAETGTDAPRVRLTDVGKAYIEFHLPELYRVFAGTCCSLSPAERHTFLCLLGRLVAAAKHGLGRGNRRHSDTKPGP